MKELKNWQIAYADYKTGQYTYQQLADKYNTSLDNVRIWKRRYWNKMDNNRQSDNDNSEDGQGNGQMDGQQIIQPVFDLARPADRLKNQLNNMIVPVVLTDIKEIDLPEWVDDNGSSIFDKLEYRQKMFVDEFMVDLNATAAAIRSGYTFKCAAEYGCRLMKNPVVKECIERRLAEASRRTGVNEAVIDRELNRLVRVNIGDVMNIETGEIRTDICRDDLAAVSSIRVKVTPTRDGEQIIEREVKLVAKEKLIELAMKRHGMLTEHKQIDIHQTINDQTTEEAKNRLKELLAKMNENTIDI